ncbi:MAG: NAD(P)-dependent oxidoreductase [Peptostreptococcus sp.]|uniref:precorrin-2 dehydrogenase/sirohydrochlorin ferrochelatase family protein n=1 Tax=Peptostreptococcus sp. TaxID=1262 RepID=UPI002FCA9A97
MFYPVMIDVEKLNILIVGGGPIASKKAKSLVKYGASLRVVAMNMCDEILDLKEQLECDKKEQSIDIRENIEKKSLDSAFQDKFEYKDEDILDREKLYDENLNKINEVMNPKDISSDIIRDAKENQTKKIIGDLYLIERKFDINDLYDADMVYLATDNTNLNKEIAHYCINHNILVNSVDNHEQSSFINTGFFEEKIDGEDIIISISSMGKNPKNTKKIKNEMKQYFEDR